MHHVLDRARHSSYQSQNDVFMGPGAPERPCGKAFAVQSGFGPCLPSNSLHSLHLVRISLRSASNGLLRVQKTLTGMENKCVGTSAKSCNQLHSGACYPTARPPARDESVKRERREQLPYRPSFLFRIFWGDMFGLNLSRYPDLHTCPDAGQGRRLICTQGPFV